LVKICGLTRTEKFQNPLIFGGQYAVSQTTRTPPARGGRSVPLAAGADNATRRNELTGRLENQERTKRRWAGRAVNKGPVGKTVDPACSAHRLVLLVSGSKRCQVSRKLTKPD